MRSLDRGVYRGTILTLKGLGEVLRPGRWSSRSGNACPSGSSRVKCCIMVMRNSSMFCLAKVSPAHTRLPATMYLVKVDVLCLAIARENNTTEMSDASNTRSSQSNVHIFIISNRHSFQILPLLPNVKPIMGPNRVP